MGEERKPREARMKEKEGKDRKGGRSRRCITGLAMTWHSWLGEATDDLYLWAGRATSILTGFFWSPVSYCSKSDPWNVNSPIQPLSAASEEARASVGPMKLEAKQVAENKGHLKRRGYGVT